MTYRELDPHAAPGNENDDWQDWPPEALDGDSGGDASLWLAKWANEPNAKDYRPSQLPDHLMPENRGGVPVPSAATAVQLATGDPKPRRRAAKKVALVLAALVALGGGAWYGAYWWTTGRYLVSTDDAYVGAKNATLSAKVTGYVSEVAVDDNVRVREGDVIARIDDGDYQLAVEAARDNVAIQQATVGRIGEQVAAQRAAVDEAKAQLVSAQAGARRAELELKRQQDLAARDFASRQTLEQAQANRDQGNAGVQAAQAALAAAEANVDVLKAQQVEAMRTLKQLQTAQAKAERDLSFTVIRAPFDGVIGNRAMQVGDWCSPGSASRVSCRSTRSTSMRISRRPSSPICSPASRSASRSTHTPITS